MTEFTLDLMKKIGFTEEEQEFVKDFSVKYRDNAVYLDLLDKFDKNLIINNDIDATLEKEAEKNEDSVYSLRLLFCLEAAEASLPKYLAMGQTEEMFYRNMTDLKCKLGVCRDVYDVVGLSAPMAWFDRFYFPSRFWLGRFQFEDSKFKFGDYEKDGVVVREGDTVINVHIPEGLPLDEKVALESYDLACEFYKEMYEKQGYLVFVCHSWLLFEDNPKILNPQSNIIKFMNQYEIIHTTPTDPFSDAWRIFGSISLNDYPHGLAENTSMQRAFKKWLCDGNKAGHSYGVRIHRKGDR